MLNTIARYISFVFNPIFLFVPVPYLLVVRETGNPIYALKWSIFTVIFLGIIGLFVLISVYKGHFTDFDVSKREQRPLLFLFVGIVSIIYFVSLYYLQGPLVLFISLNGIFLSLLIFSFLNTRIKASIHSASISALIISLALLYGGQVLLLLFLIPLIGWARVRIKRHTRQEFFVGTATGVFLTLGMYFLFKVILGFSISGQLL